MNNAFKPRVVLDTNIYISAVISSGNPRRVLELAREEKIEILISQYILSEIERVLQDKIYRNKWKTRAALLAIKNVSTLVYPILRLSIIEGHESDNRIIECAIKGNAQYIVSGDRRHILPLQEYKGIRILSPTEFLREIEN